jgi:GR25 family glycosyltransferase involved in LPS biosynthesis
MKAYVIRLLCNENSERQAERCIESGRDAGIEVEAFNAIHAEDAETALEYWDLKWTWMQRDKARVRGIDLKHHSYGGCLQSRIACALSHYELWLKCALYKEPLLILEHDAVFINPWREFEFDSICMINDPSGATPRGDWWSFQMAERGDGVWPVTRVFGRTPMRPDGLAGNSAYVIKPHAAQKLVDLFQEYGVWPNDAMMCVQLFPDMQEHYPFITKVSGEGSTIQI